MYKTYGVEPVFLAFFILVTTTLALVFAWQEFQLHQSRGVLVETELTVIAASPEQHEDELRYRHTYSSTDSDGKVLQSQSRQTDMQPKTIGSTVEGWRNLKTDTLVAAKDLQNQSFGNKLGVAGLSLMSAVASFVFFKMIRTRKENPNSREEDRAEQRRSKPAINILFGIILLMIGLQIFISSELKVGNSIKTELMVVDIEEKRSDSSTSYRATFSAQHPDGHIIEYTGNTWVSPMPHVIGETVQGWHNLETGHLVSDTLRKRYRGLSRLLGIGALVLLFWGGFVIYRRREAKMPVR